MDNTQEKRNEKTPDVKVMATKIVFTFLRSPLWLLDLLHTCESHFGIKIRATFGCIRVPWKANNGLPCSLSRVACAHMYARRIRKR